MAGLAVERIVHFGPGDFIKDGCVHFGFHDRLGRHIAIDHQGHFRGLLGAGDRPTWTVAAQPVLEGVPNIEAELEFPIYADSLPDGTLIVSNFGNARLYRIDAERMTADLLVDGHALGMADMGNCVVDDDGDIWVNEVTGCRIWHFDAGGRVIDVLGSGAPGFQLGTVGFEEAGFAWIYDIRRGPAGDIYVLDSRNFALRLIDRQRRIVRTLAGTGRPGYSGDGGDAREASLGGDPSARFDGPISLALDDASNAYVGDRFNHVVRRIDARTNVITTVAGRAILDDRLANDEAERDPLRLHLPEISSMDHHRGRLFVPTDLADGSGDLIVLRTA